jgi:hypothetical protein
MYHDPKPDDTQKVERHHASRSALVLNSKPFSQIFNYAHWRGGPGVVKKG